MVSEENETVIEVETEKQVSVFFALQFMTSCVGRLRHSIINLQL